MAGRRTQLLAWLAAGGGVGWLVPAPADAARLARGAAALRELGYAR